MPPHECSANLLAQMVRFIHTSDWQLGMTRHFLAGEAQSRFAAGRIEAIRSLGKVARDEGAAFVAVAGDVFESNLVDRQVVLRALAAMREAAVTFYLLPGNHDPLDPSSVFRSREFAANCPPNVHVLDTEPVEVAPATWLVGAPWLAKRLTVDPLAEACRRAASLSGTKVLIGHGQAETFAPDVDNPSLIRLEPLEEAISSGAVHYVGLGDRHSSSALGTTGRAWYSGSPEPTDYDETDPGNVLVADVSAEAIDVRPVRVAAWRFVRQTASIDGAPDVARLRTWLESLEAKERTVVKLGFEGTVSLAVRAELESLIEHFSSLFAAIEHRDRDNHLALLPSEADLSELGLGGFAARALDELTAQARTTGEPAEEAADALSLLYRLARGAA